MKNITPTIKYIGCDDAETRLFESQYVVSAGIAMILCSVAVTTLVQTATRVAKRANLHKGG